MEQKIKEIEINRVVYVQKDSIKELSTAYNTEGLEAVMVRTESAGVHYGYLAKRESTLAGIEVTLVRARRVWRWAGAATLSQLAMEGTKKPANCKMPCHVNKIDLVAIEIIPMPEEAVLSLNSVETWEE